jgi:predicted transcriptional regulator
MTTLRVGIATAKAMKVRSLAIVRGEVKPRADDPKVWFTSPESFAKILSNKNRALLDVILATHPESLQDLGGHDHPSASNLYPSLFRGRLHYRIEYFLRLQSF